MEETPSKCSQDRYDLLTRQQLLKSRNSDRESRIGKTGEKVEGLRQDALCSCAFPLVTLLTTGKMVQATYKLAAPPGPPAPPKSAQAENVVVRFRFPTFSLIPALDFVT